MGRTTNGRPYPLLWISRRGEHCSPFFVVAGVEARPLHSKYIGNMQ